MSRGRKSKSGNISLNWQQIYSRNAGIYLQIIITELGNLKEHGKESADELLKKIKIEKEKLIKAKKLKKESPLPTIKEEDKPYKIPKNWIWCRLGEMSINCDGARIPISQSERARREKIYDYYGASGVIDKIDGYTHDGKYLLIGEDGANLVSKSTPIAFIAEGNFWVNNHAHILDFIDEITLDFIKYCLNSVNILPFITGGFQPKLSQRNLNLIPIPLPPLSEQQKIVDFFIDFENNNLKNEEYYFNKEVEQNVISLHKSQLLAAENLTLISEQLTLIENLNQAILQEAVQGKLVPQDPTDEPASKLLERIKAEKSKTDKKEKLLPRIKPEEILFEIPENWVWCRLGEICSKIGSGSTPQGSNYSTTGFPFFRSQNIYNEGLNYDDIKFISDEVQKQMNGTSVLANDILLNITGGSMGRCALVPEDFKEGNVSQHVCIIRPLEIENSFFHKTVLSPYFQKLIFSSTTGAGREGLPKYNLEQFLIPLPPLSEQQRIVAEIEKQLIKTKELKAHIIANQQATEQLLKALLNKALGATANYNDTPPKEKINKTTTENKVRNNYTFEKLNMKIIEILQSSPQPISAHTVWNRSEYSKDIEAFYAELKRLIDIEKLVIEEKREKESFLKLAANEN
jgi:type I restriction enzyme S subunit